MSGSDLLRSLDVLNGVSVREGGTDRVNDTFIENVSNLAFSFNGTDLGGLLPALLPTLNYVNVSISVQGQTRGHTQDTSLDSNFYFRNNAL